MPDYKFIWRYGMIESWSETLIKIIGASNLIEYIDIEAHNDDNSVYVSWDGEDGSGADGTSTYPYRTIQYAKDMMNSNQTIITIMDSNYYYTGDAFTLYFDINGITLQGMEGVKPILIIDTTIASQISMIRLQNVGKLINVEIQIPIGYSEHVIGIDAREGDIKNVTIDGANKNGIQKTTADIVNIDNTIIKNSINDEEIDGSGILFQEGTLNVSYSLIHSNDYAGIIIDGSGTKLLNINHSTITNNQYGIHLINCSNLNMNVIDSIVYKNKVYDHYGSIAVYSYSCIGKINGSPVLTPLTNVLRINPLFISNEDFRLRTKYNGFGDNILTSPCVGLSSMHDDMGCYQYVRSLTGQNYQEFESPSPDSYNDRQVPIDAKILTVRSLSSKLILRGLKNYLNLEWSGNDNILTEEEYNNFRAMFLHSTSEIYLSKDNRETFIKYLIDKTKDMSGSRGLVIMNNMLRKNISITLIEV